MTCYENLRDRFCRSCVFYDDINVFGECYVKDFCLIDKFDEECD